MVLCMRFLDDHNFQESREGLNCESLTYNANTLVDTWICDLLKPRARHHPNFKLRSKSKYYLSIKSAKTILSTQKTHQKLSFFTYVLKVMGSLRKLWNFLFCEAPGGIDILAFQIQYNIIHFMSQGKNTISILNTWM